MIKDFLERIFETRISILFLSILGLAAILISRYVYTYDFKLSKQDAASYILMAKDLSNYFYINQQEAMKFCPLL